MNNKRQTIWLVSMLSLMVILSAYYLFTEDVTPAQNAGIGAEQTDRPGSAAKASDDAAQGVQITEVDPSTDSLSNPAADGTAKDTADGTTKDTANGVADQAAPSDSAAGAGADSKEGETKNQAADDGAVSPDDEAVLKEMANLKGAQLIDQLQRVQKEKIDLRNEELNAIIADTKNHTQEQASTAAEELARLDDTDSRMTSLEEKLLQDYDNAVVTEEEMNFKVVVQTAKMEKKQAVRIIDLAAKELNVSPDRLSVQYVP
jgi:stage III sporulation protein AH